MICSECGTVNNDSAKFCKRCGNSLKSGKSIEKTNSSYGEPNPTDNKTWALICVAIILFVAIFAISFATNNSNSSDVASYSEDYDSGLVSQDDNYQEYSDIFINHCDFYTGSSLSDKSYCSANIGAEHYGDEYKISVLYSRDGKNLNDGKSVSKKVDEEGFLHVSTSNAFEYYPDTAIVTIYNMDGNILTQKTYYLETHSGQQRFD